MAAVLTALAHVTNWDAFHTTHAQREEWAPGTERPQRRPLLDHPSAPHPILNMLMDEALRRILLVSDGSVMALRERVTGSRSAAAPTSDLAGIIDELGERYARCRTHRARLGVIKDAQAVADRMRYSPDRSMVRGTAEWRDAIAKDSRSCRVLAEVWGVSKNTIQRTKKDATKAEPKATIVQRGKRHSAEEREAINRKRAQDAKAALVAAVAEITVIV